MHTLGLWLRRLLLILIAVIVVAFLVSRTLKPTEAQSTALALLQAEAAVPAGDNAFAALWLLEYDVPAEEIDAVAAADVEQFRRALEGLAPEEAPENFQSSAEGRYERTQGEDSDPPLCGKPAESCLDQVRDQLEAHARRLERDRGLVDRVRGLASFGHYETLFEPDLRAPIPAMKALFLSPTANALDFVEGRVDAALENTCRDIDTWRRLGSRADSILVAMVGTRITNSNAALLADMLARLPLDYPLPGNCSRALDPQRSLPDLCPAMSMEAAAMFSHLERFQHESGWVRRVLLLDAQATSAELAPTFAHACDPGIQQQLIAGSSMPPQPELDSPWRLACVSNAAGCLLAEIGAPDYGSYLYRVQDSHAIVRTLSAVLALRDSAAAAGLGFVEALEAPGLGLQGGAWLEPTLDAASGELVLPLRDQQYQSEWRLPLPGSQLPPTTGEEA